MSAFGEVEILFGTRGAEAYFGEAVSQLEHGLQAAALAMAAGSSPALVVAALLHDVGHLLHSGGEDIASQGVDARHEEIGARWLASRFPSEVSEPVRLHVAAKRYLCGVDRQYAASLSPASVQSLALQGGAFDERQKRDFEMLAGWRDAVALRRWDDEAKIVGLAVPPLSEYRALLETLSGV